MTIKPCRKATTKARASIFVLILSVVLLFSFFLPSATAEANRASSALGVADADDPVPEDPPVQDGGTPPQHPEAETLAKQGPPEIFDDGILCYYLVDDSYYEVAGIYLPCFDHIVIPSELLGIPVKGIRSCGFRQFQYLTSVSLPESIEYIGDFAFYNCPNLEPISFPRPDIRIGEAAFQISEP